MFVVDVQVVALVSLEHQEQSPVVSLGFRIICKTIEQT